MQAKYRLGVMYFRGMRGTPDQRGIPGDRRKAMKWFLEAAGDGDADAQKMLGDIYSGRESSDTGPDYELAAKWYREAAGYGNAEAQNNLGFMYGTGLGVEQDYVKAASFFASVKASENKSATGVVAAGYELGVLYEQGLGVEQDLKKAMELYQEAAAYEYPDAIEALARLSK